MKWYLMVLKKYAVFNGRARRKEYWMFTLVNVFISILLGMIDAALMYSSVGSYNVFENVYSLIVLLPSIAVGVRRMHDVGKSGWFLLIPIYNLILAVTEGDKGNNNYGPDPKNESEMDFDPNKPLDYKLEN